jgi:hypothetical protein
LEASVWELRKRIPVSATVRSVTLKYNNEEGTNEEPDLDDEDEDSGDDSDAEEEEEYGDTWRLERGLRFTLPLGLAEPPRLA